MAETSGRLRRVLMTADTVGGVWPYAMELTGALAAHGVEVVLASMGAPLSRSQRKDAVAHANLEVRDSRFKLEWMDDPWADVARAGEWLLELERDCAPDVVHLNGYAHGSLPWRAPVLIVAHSCVLSWWRAVKGALPPARWTRYAEAVTEGLRAAGVVVAPTHAMMDALESNYGFLREVRVIPNARDPERFVPLKKQPFILSAGRIWDEAKNLQALAGVAPDLPWPVRVAGPQTGPDGGAAKLRNVEWLGRRSTAGMAHLYGHAAIYALPARYEPFGLSVLEAALAGCALVLGDIPSLRENWRDAARFVSPGDAAALRETLMELARDPGRRALLGERARQTALGFRPASMARSYLQAYREAEDAKTRTHRWKKEEVPA